MFTAVSPDSGPAATGGMRSATGGACIVRSISRVSTAGLMTSFQPGDAGGGGSIAASGSSEFGVIGVLPGSVGGGPGRWIGQYTLGNSAARLWYRFHSTANAGGAAAR